MNFYIPFDQEGTVARYEITVSEKDLDAGDGILLACNREGLLALASVFQQLADPSTPDGSHVHLGYNEMEPQGPGWRITLSSSGRAD
jgi:hypothetical protein